MCTYFARCDVVTITPNRCSVKHSQTHTGLGFQLGEQYAPNGDHTDSQNHDSENLRNRG
jgi:hypothetical protein